MTTATARIPSRVFLFQFIPLGEEPVPIATSGGIKGDWFFTYFFSCTELM